MKKFIVWNIEEARPIHGALPLSYRDALRLADRVEVDLHRPFTVVEAPSGNAIHL